MKRYHIYIAFFIIIGFLFSLCHKETIYARQANLTKKTGYVISQDRLRKIMTQRLGTPYSKMDCSAYAAWVVTHMGEQTPSANAISSVKLISGKSTYDWRKKGKIKISYRPAKYQQKNDAWVWAKTKKISLNKSMKSSNSSKARKKVAKTLKVGDALLYSGREHIALYFGQFESVDAVVKYLKEECGMKHLKKGTTPAGNVCYRYKGKVILIHYRDCGAQWRIHSTNTFGVIIDNDLTFHNGQYGGNWDKTVRYIETNVVSESLEQ